LEKSGYKIFTRYLPTGDENKLLRRVQGAE
jgi:hypothetical protein